MNTTSPVIDPDAAAWVESLIEHWKKNPESLEQFQQALFGRYRRASGAATSPRFATRQLRGYSDAALDWIRGTRLSLIRDERSEASALLWLVNNQYAMLIEQMPRTSHHAADNEILSLLAKIGLVERQMRPLILTLGTYAPPALPGG